MATTPLEVPSLKGPDRRASRRRRMLLPVLTAVVAVVVWMYSERVGPGRDADVERFVRRLIEEAAPPRPTMSGIPDTERVISDLVRETLRDMRADGSPPSFTLHRRESGEGHAQATHTAIVLDDSGARLALGLRHPGDAARLGIVGIEIGMRPPASSVPAPAPAAAGDAAAPPAVDSAPSVSPAVPISPAAGTPPAGPGERR